MIGAYEIISYLGEGAMATVYRARDLRLGRDVSLKILHCDLAANPKTLERFRMEAHAASILNHPNIVTIHEVGEADGLHFMTMEYVEGERLRDMLRGGPLTLRTVVRIMAGVADGLAAAHARGIIHRDLKPENIMMSRDGFVKILDFGLAKLFQGECVPGPDEQTLRRPGEGTGHGVVVGTPSYMSPEQVVGEGVDHRADQFAFGTLVFEMISRRRPFDRATSVETMTAILRDPAPRLSRIVDTIPSEIEQVVDRCLSKDIAGRYRATADLAHDIHELRDRYAPGSEASARPPLERPVLRKRFVGWTFLIVLVVVAGALFTQIREGVRGGSVQDSALQTSLLPRPVYLAILPFEESGGNLEAELYANGFAETISIRLGDIQGLQIIPPAALQGLEGNPSTIAREVGANLILDWSLRQLDEALRVNYMLILPDTGTQLAAGTVNGRTSDPFLLEDRLADSILNDLQIRIAGSGHRETNRDLLDPEAQDRYLTALGALQRYENEDSVDFAIGQLESLHEEIPASALVGAALGRACLYKFQLSSDPAWADRAITVAEATLRRHPTLPEVHNTYGEVLTRLGRYEDATLHFRRALAERPDFAEAILGLAEAFDRAGRDDEARAAYVKAISVRPMFAGNYNKLGMFYYRRGELEQAAEQLERVLELTPDNTRALNNLGVIKMNTGRFLDAAADYRTSIEIRETAPAWSNLGTALYYGGQFEEASAAFRKAIAFKPHDHTYWMNLGDAYRWSDGASRPLMFEAYERAIDLAGDALELNPEDNHAHVSLSALYAKTGRPELARKHVRRALAVAPQDPDVLLLAGITMHLLNDDGAIDLLTQARAAGISEDVLEREPELVHLREDDRWSRLFSTDNL